MSVDGTKITDTCKRSLEKVDLLLSDDPLFVFILTFNHANVHIGNAGVPIKLLYEAEGMKVTVEVSVELFLLTRYVL